MASSTSPSYLDEPLDSPPPGEHSDFDHPPSRARELYTAAGVCIPLILIFAALRFYAKIVIKKKKSWDDCKSYVYHPNDCIHGIR